MKSHPAKMIARDQDRTDPADPRTLPPVDIRVARLQIGSIPFQKVELVTSKTPSGIQLVNLQMLNENVIVMASNGVWESDGSATHSSIEASIEGKNVEYLFATLGIPPKILESEFRADCELSWNDAPERFSLQSARGKIRVLLEKGKIADENSFLLKTFSLLTLNIGELYRGDLSFLGFHGVFQLAQGQLESVRTDLELPGASLNVTGKFHLRDRTFDNLIVVYPRINTPLVSTALAILSPQAGFQSSYLVLQSKDRSRSSRKLINLTYRLSGAFDAPKLDYSGNS